MFGTTFRNDDSVQFRWHSYAEQYLPEKPIKEPVWWRL